MNRSASDSNHSPFLTIILIVYQMREQAKKTLFSLSPAYQHNVTTRDYEVVVVENSSDQMLGQAKVEAFGKNYRYFLRPNTSSSPVEAINFGAQKARGAVIGIMIDGARLVSPGVIQYILAVYKISPQAIVSVPGYHIGHELQQNAVEEGYNEAIEAQLLEQINWPDNGYGLFDIACFSGSCHQGFFLPMGESNCLCIPKNIYAEIGGCDPRFDLPGGGAVNLDLYKRVCELTEIELFILNGEGTFHQFHGGVTTGKSFENNQVTMNRIFGQYRRIRGGNYIFPERQGIYIGKLSSEAMRFVRYSLDLRQAWEQANSSTDSAPVTERNMSGTARILGRIRRRLARMRNVIDGFSLKKK